MKKILMGIILCLMMTFGMFSQETDNTYWHKEIDVDGELITYYFCKTDAQFDNTFKDIVKDKLGIVGYQEPNWNYIKSGLVSIEYIEKNFPKLKCITDNNIINWDNYKYCWCITDTCDMPIIKVATRINGIVCMSISIMYGYYQWAYTLETLELFESLL